jgi:excisionase family DNA binding protein
VIEAFLPLLLTKKQVAYFLSTTIWGVEELERKGKLTAYKSDGKTVKFKEEDVRAYVASLREARTPDIELR